MNGRHVPARKAGAIQNPAYRPAGEYLSFYRLDGRDVVILRMLHGRRAIGGEDFSD
jgi:hypothetical protein